MTEIRNLTINDMEEAIQLKVQCWTEELAGKEKNTLEHSKELRFWVDWMNSAKENCDVRLLIGAFEDDNMLGVAFASFAEVEDIPQNGIELNGLWVYPQYRGRGISLKLILHILNYFSNLGKEKIIIYNHHYAPSNNFYRKFGANVIRQDKQMNGKLLIDVFVTDIDTLKNNIVESLSINDVKKICEIDTRNSIIDLLKNSFINEGYVYAMWLEGSDGLLKADEYSDLDFWLDVEDGYENIVLDKCVEVLQTIDKLDFIQHYDHPHPKIFQKNMHISGTSEYLMLDICVQSHSRGNEGCTFVENDIAEFSLILFDKSNVINIIEKPKIDLEQIKKVYNESVDRFNQHSRIIKYIYRNKYLEAHAYYYKFACTPIVNMFRIIYTPRHIEYGIVHISDHLPKEVVTKIELLYKVSSLEDIKNNLIYAQKLFNEAKACVDNLYYK